MPVFDIFPLQIPCMVLIDPAVPQFHLAFQSILHPEIIHNPSVEPFYNIIIIVVLGKELKEDIRKGKSKSSCSFELD